MDSFTDERNSWFNAVRLEDSRDYSAATLAYIDDASRCLGRSYFIRAAMSVSCAASCLATMGDFGDAVEMYSATASLYENNADISIGRSIRESLWSLLHAFEYYTLVSDHVSAERTSKKYADLARRVERFESRTAFETLKIRRENVLDARSKLNSLPKGVPVKIPDLPRVQRSVKAFLQQVQTTAKSDDGIPEEEDDDQLVYETESDLTERRIVS
jgi:hypothetical protein